MSATTDFSWTRNSTGEQPFINTDSNDFTPWMALTMDLTNVLSATQTAVGAIEAGASAYPLGICLVNVTHQSAAPYNQGRLQNHGWVQGLAGAAITAGAILKGATGGKLVTQTSGTPQFGQSLTTAGASTDLIMVALAFANNA